MMFDPLQHEVLIQERWNQEKAFRAPFAREMNPGTPTFYMLVMLPYPSGRIHMGHVRNYTLGDVVARYQRMRGKKVMHTMGWDSFGLPAENAAIQHQIHPAVWTRKNIADMKKQIQRLGISYDWDRELASFEPAYYRWNQWFFLQMWKRGDVFRALRNVNWCEALGTVLANEQVVDGKDERTGHPVIQKPMEQYFFAITKYADELVSGLESLDWPENIKAMQRHWIGRSEGARFSFELTSGARVPVFTTRMDTLFGVSFLALSTEHPVIQEAIQTDPGLLHFCQTIAKQSREERLTSDIKLGHPTQLQARHPITGDLIPVFAANYVLMDYGTGAVMGVPGHDERDHEFASKYQLPIPKVIDAPSPWEPGVLIHSGSYSGMTSEEASRALVQALASSASAEPMLSFKLKDWGLSRQRYWGTPIPTVHCPKCGVVPETENHLPILLPEDIEFSGRGASPLTTSETFLQVACPSCGTNARRETDTMDTFVDSSWYWLRYLDSQNPTQAFSPDEAQAWTPVDLYIGGVEHATMHLIYARYFHKVLRDLGMAHADEPFQRLICQGMVLKDGFKMSKSKGNTVDPDEVIGKYGSDALRLFMIFASPIEKEIDWTGFEGIEGAARFLKRVERLIETHTPTSAPLPPLSTLSSEEKKLLSKLHQTLQRMTDDLEVRYSFNTLVSSLMELLNAIQEHTFVPPRAEAIRQHVWDIFVRLLAPTAPHLAEHLWTRLGHEGFVAHAAWPSVISELLITDEILVVVQVNGKVRARLLLPSEITDADKQTAALQCLDIQPWLQGKTLVKVVVPAGGKIVSIVVKDV